MRVGGCGPGAGGLRPVRPYKAVQEEVTALRAMLDDMLVRNQSTQPPQLGGCVKIQIQLLQSCWS